MKEGFSMPFLIIFAIIIFAVLIADKKHKESQLPRGMKKCPHCQNLIDKKATVCHYCLRKVSSESLLSVLFAFALVMVIIFLVISNLY